MPKATKTGSKTFSKLLTDSLISKPENSLTQKTTSEAMESQTAQDLNLLNMFFIIFPPIIFL